MDHLIQLESSIREAFIKEQLVVVFFDNKTVYDTLWRQGVVGDLKELGLER